ncbi:hypothetical protein GCM10022222_66900 [Amycolatopsis ultiminotia]|uniref:TetR family transcriptional regulator n=1 Tax=Amycolatopsis ultiminotia TaxID=543629 RepID=A0ABP6XVU3_9PSEU
MAAPRRGRPAKLSLETIVEAALPRDPDQVTMQAVATELGVAPSALYRWVRDREHLLDLVSAELARRITTPDLPTAQNWRQWLLGYARDLREGLHEVPGFAVRLLTGPHRHTGPTAVEEAVVAAFRFGGADEALARQYWYAYSTAIMGWVAAEQNRHHQPAVTPDFEVLIDVLLRGTDQRRPD